MRVTPASAHATACRKTFQIRFIFEDFFWTLSAFLPDTETDTESDGLCRMYGGIHEYRQKPMGFSIRFCTQFIGVCISLGVRQSSEMPWSLFTRTAKVNATYKHLQTEIRNSGFLYQNRFPCCKYFTHKFQSAWIHSFEEYITSLAIIYEDRPDRRRKVMSCCSGFRAPLLGP